MKKKKKKKEKKKKLLKKKKKKKKFDSYFKKNEKNVFEDEDDDDSDYVYSSEFDKSVISSSSELNSECAYGKNHLNEIIGINKDDINSE